MTNCALMFGAFEALYNLYYPFVQSVDTFSKLAEFAQHRSFVDHTMNCITVVFTEYAITVVNYSFFTIANKH